MIVLGSLTLVWFIKESSGETIETGTAPTSIEFDGSFSKFYDIYAESMDSVTVTMSSEKGSQEFTYLSMCEGAYQSTIGITGDCGEQRGDLVLIGDLTVGASESGWIRLDFEGTGDVAIVELGVGSSIVLIGLFFTGCCFAPIIAVYSLVKIFRKDGGEVDTKLEPASAPDDEDATRLQTKWIPGKEEDWSKE
jgi:hypothetical protein